MLAHDGAFAALFSELKRPGVGVCRVWELTLAPDTAQEMVIRLTDHNKNVTIGGDTYDAIEGLSASAMRSSVGGFVDTVNTLGLTSGTLTDSKIIRGLFDDARMLIGIACWQNTAAGIWWHARLMAGKVESNDTTFDIEWRKLTDFITRPFGRAYLGDCDVKEFGDARCGLDLDALGFVHTGEVTAQSVFSDGFINSRVFEIDVVQADGYFQFGDIEFTSGQNIGFKSEILAHASDVVSLLHLPPWPIEVGTTFTIKRGCPRTWDFCKDEVNNLVGPGSGGGFKGFGARKGDVLWFMPPDEILQETPESK